MDNIYQQTCKACEQVITLSTPDPLIEYCLACTEELNEWHDTNHLTNDGFNDWAAQYDDDPNPYHGTYSEM